MYDYIALRIDAKPSNEAITDLLAAFLAEEEFETFVPDEDGLTAYVRKDKYNKKSIEKIIEGFPIETELAISETEIKGEDWNKEWEQNYFKPINIDDRLVIRSSFHTDYPKCPLQIIIDPKMAFGTGHHATTAGMSLMLLNTPLEGKRVIDMGTGTGILSILAKKLGAKEVTGIDIDEFAIENAYENGLLNDTHIKWIAGDDRSLVGLEPADIFLANINLNVIKSNLGKYVATMKEGGKIFLSGFLSKDIPEIEEEACKYGLKMIDKIENNNWVTISYRRY